MTSDKKPLKSGARKTGGMMEIDAALLARLVCPRSGGILEHVGDELVCRKSRLAYPIHDGVPVMIIDEARTLDDDE